MNKQETLGRIVEIDAEIKRLEKERKQLRANAIANGWAIYKVHIRLSAPSLAWWKEHRPATWEKHCSEKPVKTFTVV